MTEVWKDIEGIELLKDYQVSNLGRVRSTDRYITRYVKGEPRKWFYPGRIRALHAYPNGYISLVIKERGAHKSRNFLVHRLVATAFVPGYFEGAVVNHKDENKSNNRADNLEWVTDRENRVYGTAQERLHRSQCIQVEQLDMDGNHIRDFPSIREAARAVNGDMKTIRMCCIGHKWHHSHKGFKWRYKIK